MTLGVYCSWNEKVCFCSYNRVVNVSSQLGSLNCVSPPLQKQFSSSTLTEAEIVSLMEKYLRYVSGSHNQIAIHLY